MKKPIDYKPKYSMSVAYLKKCMTSAEFKTLEKKYVEAKIANWENWKNNIGVNKRKARPR